MSMSDYIPGTQKYAANDVRQTAITEALASYVAGDLLPLSVAESRYFLNLMEKANPRAML